MTVDDEQVFEARVELSYVEEHHREATSAEAAANTLKRAVIDDIRAGRIGVGALDIEATAEPIDE